MSGHGRWCWAFDEPLPAGADARALLGGKGASLRGMTEAGLPVPPGFTISTEACAAYTERGRRWPAGLEAEVRDQLARLEAATGRTLGREAPPLLVSVRSGAAVSMPGMMDTLLNCGLHPGLAADVGDTPAFWSLYAAFIHSVARTVHGLGPAALADLPSPASREAVEAHLARYADRTGEPLPTDPWGALVLCIGAVFDSWENERAVAYRRRNDVRGLAGTAVNVQAMFPSEVSGIVFTEDPSAVDASRMVIEASYGLGEAVVSGDVTPDRFVLDRETGRVVETELGHKAARVGALGVDLSDRDPDATCLSEAQLADLRALCLRVEAYFGHPVDVEWGLAEGAFGLLQARAIRGLDVAREVEVAREAEAARLRAAAADGRRVWVAHNLGETLPAPTPLTWDIVRRFMSGDGGFGKLYRDLGYRPSARVRRDGFLELIAGRVYADPARQAELFWDAMPLVYDVEAVRADPTVLDAAPTTFDPDRADGRFLTHLPTTLLAMARVARRSRQARAGAKRRFEADVLPPFLDWVDAARDADLGALSDAQLLAELDARRARVLDAFGPESLRPGFFGGMAFGEVAGLLGDLLGPVEGEALAARLVRGLEGDTTFEQEVMLHRVARGEAMMEAFLAAYGHRAAGEMELSVPRWREDPVGLEPRLAACRRDGCPLPEAVHAANVAAREEAEAELPGALAAAGGSALREDIEAALAEARALLPYRESGKHYLMMGYELVRLVTEELAARWDLGRDLYFLHLDELGRVAAERQALLDRAGGRRVRWQALQRLDVPEVVDSEDLDRFGYPPEFEAADRLEGAAIAPGSADGPARIVLDPREAGDLGEGYVLVCPSTDPGWAPLLACARALVVERGGVLSHGAIVARDFGIPAVACPGATRRIRDGATVRVDGSRGQVILQDGGDA